MFVRSCSLLIGSLSILPMLTYQTALENDGSVDYRVSLFIVIIFHFIFDQFRKISLREINVSRFLQIFEGATS